MYQWSRDVVKGLSVIESVKSYLPELVGHLGRDIDLLANDFINAPVMQRVENVGGVASISPENIFTHNGISLDVCTVHSIKGTTNTATLFLETYYNKKYESERLKSQINGSVDGCISLMGRDKEAAKMIYVGFSRPTHLLAFAIHKSRFTTLGLNASDDIWVTKDISA